jgi:hypothetical protein
VPESHKPSRRLPRGGGALALLTTALLLSASPASAAPVVVETWSSQTFSATARLQAKINPEGAFTTYHFDYITRSQYEANGNNFTGASRVPASFDANIGSGTSPVAVQQQISGLKAGTAYRYRVVAKNTTTTTGPEKELRTQAVPPGSDSCPNATARSQTGAKGSELADCRAFELVSPLEKNGGEVALPGEIAAGGVLQAAAQGSAVTYGSEASFAGGQGAPPASQYLATRGGGGWSTQNLTQPIFSGTYDSVDQGVPWQLFSEDLSRGILLNGDHCRGEGSNCAVANPPLVGTDAPAGYQNYYLRQDSTFTALLGAANAGFLALEPKVFDLRLAGSSADLTRPVISTCAALTANATEVPDGEGCDPEAQNLYLWSGSGLTLINLLPAQSSGAPGAELAAQSGAVSSDGSRVYFTQGGDLWLRASGFTKHVDEDAGGGGVFETASADGNVAYFTKEEHLWRYLAGADSAIDLTPSGGVKGVLGASSSANVVYFQDGAGLKRWRNGIVTTVASGAEAAFESNWPPTTGTSRVSPDGSKLLFTSKEQLTGYDNTDLATGQPDSQVFLFDATGAGTLTCVSCNPTMGRPVGASTIPGSVANGTAAGSTNSYKPRVLSANGKRVFFDSDDALVLADTNKAPDAYQWEAQGEGSCNRQGGCVSLISDGRSAGGSSFLDASGEGSDAFFLTAGSPVKADPGAVDLYDARVEGGFAEGPPEIVCEGDACQPLPSPPTDPTLTTLITGPGNPGIRFPGEGRKRCPKGKKRVVRKGKARCVKRGGKNKKAKRRAGRKTR